MTALSRPVTRLPQAEPGAPNVEQRINNQLSGTVISYLAAPVRLNYRYITNIQHVASLSINPEREYRGMFKEPKFIIGIAIPNLGEAAHGSVSLRIVLEAQVSDDVGFLHSFIYSTIITFSSSCNAK